jgi:YbbR domain-containing protein
MAVRRAEVRGSVRDLTGGERDLKVFVMNENEQAEDITIEPDVVRVRANFTKAVREIRARVNVQVKGVPGGGLEVGSVVVSPDVIALRGTKDAIRGVSEIVVEPIDVTGHTEDMHVEIPLEAPPGMDFAGTNRVSVDVKFQRAVENRTYLSVHIGLRGVENAKDWVVSPPSASVTVEKERPEDGSPAFDPERVPLELYIDATNVVASQMVLPILTQNEDAGIKVIRIEPRQVTLTAEKR